MACPHARAVDTWYLHRFPDLSVVRSRAVSVDSVRARDSRLHGRTGVRRTPRIDLLPSGISPSSTPGFWFERESALSRSTIGSDTFSTRRTFPIRRAVARAGDHCRRAPPEYIDAPLGIARRPLRKILHDNAARLYGVTEHHDGTDRPATLARRVPEPARWLASVSPTSVDGCVLVATVCLPTSAPVSRSRSHPADLRVAADYKGESTAHSATRIRKPIPTRAGSSTTTAATIWAEHNIRTAWTRIGRRLSRRAASHKTFARALMELWGSPRSGCARQSRDHLRPHSATPHRPHTT